ncbi:MAG: hypothetical protein AVDCRST_MAG19-2132 [uncultured Thermomicrobiales bacterium]|uniref:Uncharacterized protein n=1 Tax=uncultured Thermomicrobiales bacterium TaxID=1645740 RepID=A0A6J4V0P5_9BACT|nr:MAG: hypothetical protein AVDCRST_MAG19-2132 [uncultured Thermomicrobiales bacterium]
MAAGDLQAGRSSPRGHDRPKEGPQPLRGLGVAAFALRRRGRFASGRRSRLSQKGGRRPAPLACPAGRSGVGARPSRS